MTNTRDPQADWNQWMTEHEAVRHVAERFKPWLLYKLKTTGQIVGLTSFDEDETIKVVVLERYNDPADWRTGFEVFGINPDDLEVWDQPYDA